MSWCPVCRSEYVNGRTTCFDCGATLVESLEGLEDNEAVTNDMIDFNSLSDEMKQRVLVEMQKEHIDPRKLFNQPTKEGSLQNIARIIDEENGLSYDEYMEEAAKAAQSSVPAFERLSDKVKDYNSSFVSLLIVGIAGIVFLIAQLSGLISFLSLSGFSRYLFAFVMGAMFLGFIYAGIHAKFTAKKLSVKAREQDEYMKKLEEWISSNIKSEVIDKEIDVSKDIDIVSNQRFDRIRESLLSYDANIDPSMLEYYIEQTYISLFEK